MKELSALQNLKINLFVHHCVMIATANRKLGGMIADLVKKCGPQTTFGRVIAEMTTLSKGSVVCGTAPHELLEYFLVQFGVDTLYAPIFKSYEDSYAGSTSADLRQKIAALSDKYGFDESRKPITKLLCIFQDILEKEIGLKS